MKRELKRYKKNLKRIKDIKKQLEDVFGFTSKEHNEIILKIEKGENYTLQAIKDLFKS